MSKKNTTSTKTTNHQTPTPLFADTNVTMKTGHLTRDAEIVGDGKFVKLRFAGNKQYQNSNGEVKTITNFFNAMISSNLKDAFAIAETLQKGDWVYVKGEDSTKPFDTPEGYKQTASTIFAYKVTLKKKAADKATQSSTPSP